MSCREHSRVALRTFERVFFEFVEPLLGELARRKGVTVEQLLDLYESGQERLDYEMLLKAVDASRVTKLVVGAAAGWIRKRGPLTYEDTLKLSAECGLSLTASFLRAYPNLSQALLCFLNSVSGYADVC